MCQQQFCHSRSSQIVFLVAPFRYWRPQLGHPSTWLLRDNVWVSQEGLTWPSGQNQAHWWCFHYFVYFNVGFNMCAKILYNRNGTRKCQSSLSSVPTSAPAAWGSSSLEGDGVKSPLMPLFTQFGVFTVSHQCFCNVRRSQAEKAPCEPSETEKHRNSQACEHSQHPLSLHFPKSCFAGRLE